MHGNTSISSFLYICLNSEEICFSGAFPVIYVDVHGSMADAFFLIDSNQIILF